MSNPWDSNHEKLGEIFQEGILDRVKSKGKQIANSVRNVGAAVSGNQDKIINTEQRRFNDYFSSLQNRIDKEVRSMLGKGQETQNIAEELSNVIQMSFEELKKNSDDNLRSAGQVQSDGQAAELDRLRKEKQAQGQAPNTTVSNQTNSQVPRNRNNPMSMY